MGFAAVRLGWAWARRQRRNRLPGRLAPPAFVAGSRLVGVALALAPSAALAADKGGFADSPIGLMFVLAALTLVPFVLVTCTSFLKIAVVLSILRNALGTPQVPPTTVVTGLAILLSAFIMAPTGAAVLKEVRPVLGDGAKGAATARVDAMIEAAERAKEPLRAFLLKHAHPKDRAALLEMARRMRPQEERGQVTDRDFLVLAPAFVLSELSEAFLIGFLLFVPFLVIDMLVANLLLALGMQMLSPNTVSLPFKLLLFVLVDGWRLLVRGLIGGY